MENELPQDAQIDSSPITDDQTQNSVESAQGDSSTPESAQASSSQQQDANQGAVPNNGLPPKDNLYGEFRRKIFDEIAPIIQGTVREAMLGAQGQVGNAAQPKGEEYKYQGKYSKADLESILRHPDANEYDKNFANRGLSVIEAKEEAIREFQTHAEKQANQSRQAQALQGIVQDYPQIYNRQTNSWNFADPLFQRAMQFYNSDDRLRAFGNEGMRVAVDRAYAQLAREGQVTIQKEKVKLTTKQRAIDKNHSQALSAGTLTPGKPNIGADNSKAKLMEAWKKNPDDATLKEAALKNLIPKSWLT